VLLSPNFPQYYGHDLTYAWDVIVPVGMYIQLSFDYQELAQNIIPKVSDPMGAGRMGGLT
jgi:hypothetical protein